MGVLTNSSSNLYADLSKVGLEATEIAKVMNILEAHTTRKDTMPVGGRPRFDSRLYENGPFGALDTEITSTVPTVTTPLLEWIPTQRIASRNTRVSHIDWIAPKGYTGAETYPEWLSGIEIGECGYGPETTWSGFNYQVGNGSFSWKTSMMKPYEDGGVRYYEDYPVHNINGVAMPSDKEWAVARVLLQMEQHLGYVVKHGDARNSDMEWDGLDQIVRTGYVASRVYNGNPPTWADPIIFNGVTMTTPGKILESVRILVRSLRKRARSRGWGMGPTDMVVYMSSTMWDNLSEHVAAMALYNYTNAYGFTGQITSREFREEYRETRTGGLGYGTLDIDGMPIAVLTDDNMGAIASINPDGNGASDHVVSDIFVLTRRAGGNTFWQQEYIDWNQLEYPSYDETRFALQGGLVRAGWVTEANKCFFYYGEMAGRLVCRMLPMQGRITSAAVKILSQYEQESSAPYSPDYYAFGTQQGGMGNVLLTGQP